MTIVPLATVPSYSEVGQVNSLRWTFLHKEDNGDFTQQSGKIKCKDFFNDVVSAYRGHCFDIYGFDTRKMKFNEEGVYIQLSDLMFKEQLLSNIGSINNKAVEQGMPPVEIVDAEACVILLPRAWFQCTYFISLLTYCIRIAHTDCVGTYEQIVDAKFNAARAADCPFTEYADKILSRGFVLPSPVLEGFPFLLYGSSKEDNEGVTSAGAIHNNGVHNWWWYMGRLKIEEGVGLAVEATA